MFPHEEFLKKALQECLISTLVQDLANLYVALVNVSPENDDEDFQKALAVSQILQRAASEIALLGPKPKIQHPLDPLYKNNAYPNDSIFDLGMEYMAPGEYVNNPKKSKQ